MHEARKVGKVQSLSQPLTAEYPASLIPIQYMVLRSLGLFLVVDFWRSFGLDVVAFVEQRCLPTFSLTLTAYDGWRQVQATWWGACASELEVQDLAKDLSDSLLDSNLKYLY